MAAASSSSSMSGARRLQLGVRLPDLVGDSQVGVVRARDLLAGSWGVLVAFPRAPDPVWASELGMLQKLKREFDARHCRVLAVSCGRAELPVVSTGDVKAAGAVAGPAKLAPHVARLVQFLADVNETQEVKVSFPVLADDEGGALARQLGMGEPAGAQFSCMALLDLDLTVRLLVHYPLAVGRNFYELLRALDALQLATFHQVATPANWKASDDVFVAPALAKDDAARLFPQGFHEIKPFLRLTASPAIATDEDGG
jgi:alkyl hydroperoxide reductase subunit AhpC